MKNKHKLELTNLEILALIEILDTFSAISDGIDDNGQSKKCMIKVDKMLNKNGFKRNYK